MLTIRTSLLVTKQDELKRYEESLLYHKAQLDDREERLLAREQALLEREEALSAKEDVAGVTEKRLNHAADALKAQWEKLREEKAGGRPHDQLGMLYCPRDE